MEIKKIGNRIYEINTIEDFTNEIIKEADITWEQIKQFADYLFNNKTKLGETNIELILYPDEKKFIISYDF